MAVQAQQQFLENPTVLCTTNNNNSSSSSSNNRNGDRSAMGWVHHRGEIQQQQQQQMKTGVACSGLVNQQVSAMGYNYPPPSNGVIPPEFLCSLAPQIDMQKKEIDQLLCVQSERLRAALQRQAKQHLLSLMRTLEAKASSLLGRKEEELARARKVTAELEECLRRSEAESQAWQRLARENEAMAVALGNALQQVRDHPAASCCGSSDDPSSCPGNRGGRGGEPEEAPCKAAAGRCRGCGDRDCRVLFLPCMHLCACKLCDPVLASCPVCRSVKQGSIEVFMS